MKTIVKKFGLFVMLALMFTALCAPALASAPSDAPEGGTQGAQESVDNTVSWKAIAAGLAIGVTATAGAIAMGMTTSKALESIARQPEAEGKIRTALMLGLVFMETAIIYALLAGILIIFVL